MRTLTVVQEPTWPPGRRLRLCLLSTSRALRWRAVTGELQDGSGLVRALLVADNVPWPPLGGGLVRLAQVVEAVASVSDLDLFVLHNQDRSKVEVPSTVTVLRSMGVQKPAHIWSPPVAPGMGGSPGAPRRGSDVPCRPSAPGGIARLGPSALRRGVVLDPRSYEWLGRPDLGPTIVDLDNLEDLKARLRAELLVDRRQSSPPA